MSWFKSNEEWIEANIPRTDVSEVDDYKNRIKIMSNELLTIKNQIPELSQKLAPQSATTPSLEKRITAGSGYALQGGCTDGTYIYFYIKAQTDSNAGTFVKIKRSDYSVISTKSLSLYHGNDMCYNPDTGLIYAATTYLSGISSRIDFIDPSALSRIDQKYVPFYISAIAYDSSKKLFVGASGSLTKFIFKLNENDEFELFKTITVTSSPSFSAGRSSQSITCDSAFIYHSWSAAPNVYIEIFDWLGNYKGLINKSISYSDSSLGSVSMEVEFIDKTAKNDFIMGTYASGKGSNSPKYFYTFSTS